MCRRILVFVPSFGGLWPLAVRWVRRHLLLFCLSVLWSTAPPLIRRADPIGEWVVRQRQLVAQERQIPDEAMGGQLIES